MLLPIRVHPYTLHELPYLRKLRTEKLLPRCTKSNTESEEANRDIDLNDMLLPMDTNDSTDMLDDNRAPLRIESVLPNVVKSNIDVLDPNLICENVLRLDPILTKCRKDKDEPSAKQSRSDKEEPNRIIPYTLVALPHRIKLRQLIALPTKAISRTDS